MLKFLLLVFSFTHFCCFGCLPLLVFFFIFSICSFLFTPLYEFSYYVCPFFFLDKLSFSLVILTLLIFCLSILSSSSIFNSSTWGIFILNLVFLNFILVVTFLMSKILIFFFFFESSLIPTLYLILGWGMKIERIQSGFFLFFYTVFGSMPMMLGLSFLLGVNFFMCFCMVEVYYFSFTFICFFLPFLMKLPMFLVHSWLPKAHVEAPVSGSMILAGILLKLGGYGLIRFVKVFKVFLIDFVLVFVCLSLVGGVLSGLICLRQTDMKSLIAYSSVSHMSLIVCSVFTKSNWGVLGCCVMMISHGFCSSCLFSLVNFNYERSMSRSMVFNKGLLSVVPNLSFWWFVFCCFNMSCPPSMNLIGEIFLFTSILSFSAFSFFYLLLMPFISAVYSLNLFSFTQHGKALITLGMVSQIFVREYLILLLHFFPLFFSFLSIEFLFGV